VKIAKYPAGVGGELDQLKELKAKPFNSVLD
jgi:hypothetical protein